MQLLICPGYHAPELTSSFLRCLKRQVSPTRLWVMPIWQSWGALPWLFHPRQGPKQDQPLQIIAFSAGVVAAYPLALAWHHRGGHVRLLALDGWGMPLMGGFSICRMSHDRWTHSTTYLPSPGESQGYFYAEPAVDHLFMWQAPHATIGTGAINGAIRKMTALDFIATVLAS